MNKLKIISLIFGAIGALVALIGLAVSLLNISQDNEQDRIKRWQAVVVYSIIEKGTSAGSNSAMSIDDISSKYVDAALKFAEYDLPKSAISDEMLQWVILDLRCVLKLPPRVICAR